MRPIGTILTRVSETEWRELPALPAVCRSSYFRDEFEACGRNPKHYRESSRAVRQIGPFDRSPLHLATNFLWEYYFGYKFNPQGVQLSAKILQRAEFHLQVQRPPKAPALVLSNSRFGNEPLWIAREGLRHPLILNDLFPKRERR